MGRPAYRRPALPGTSLDLHAAYWTGHAVRVRVSDGGAEPAWAEGLDPLETLFLGMIWPEYYGDAYRFANACATWLRILGGTPHWPAIESFAGDALAVSREFDLAVGSRDMYRPLRERLSLAPADVRRLPRDLLPRKILHGARCLAGPARNLRLPDPPPDAAERVKGFHADSGGYAVTSSPGLTPLGGLTTGLRLLRIDGGLGVLSHPSYGSIGLVKALYLGLVHPPDDKLPGDLVNRALAWSLGLPAESPLVPVVDVLLVSVERGLESEETLRHLFGVPELEHPVSAEDREWRSTTGMALRRLAEVRT